jgi:Rps23 Pro-64 3,4-dihydroxylase Tpa1-like proline 4-hydroxylase
MSNDLAEAVIRPIDTNAIRSSYRSAKPFPFFVIENFLEEDFAHEVANAYPSYSDASRVGFQFDALNEKLKIQITDQRRFPEPVKRLSDALASPRFLQQLESITGTPRLLADPELHGGGMHLTNSSGRLDVHVDFNILPHTSWHRRLNILVYLNREWNEEWGGRIELWDKEVRKCCQSFLPIFNRCVVFETSSISYHGVTPVRCPPGHARRSFAAYYYTQEAPPGWNGEAHSTIFRARPTERLRGGVLMPAERFKRRLTEGLRSIKRALLPSGRKRN